MSIVFYERNSKILSVEQPEVYKKTQSPENVNVFPKINIGFHAEKEGEPATNLAMYFADKLFIDGKDTDVVNWAKQINPSFHTIVIMGFGLAYHVEEVLKQYPDKRIIVIEPDKRRLVNAMHLRDLELVFKNCDIWLDDAIDTIKGKMYDMLTHPLSRGIQFLPYITLYEDFYFSVCAELEKITSDFAVQLNTKRTLVNKWYTNRIVNAKVPQTVNFKNYIGKFNGIPALLVGAGPSLQEHLEDIRKIVAENRAVVYAAGTTIQILVNHGIIPHFMGAIDQDPISEGGLHENLDADTVLIFDGQVACNSLHYKGRKVQMCLNVNRYTGVVIPNLPIVESAPSIANVGLGILQQMGCAPIIIVGMDLSYSDNKKMYCDGTVFQEEIDPTLNRMMVLTNQGELVPTEPTFMNMAHWFEDYVARMKPLVFNCTAKGAQLKGIPWIPLSQVDFSKQFDIKRLMEDCWMFNGKPDYINVRAVKANNELLCNELERIIYIVQKNGGITPEVSTYRVWSLLDDYINVPTFIAEVECEESIKKGTDKEVAVANFQKERADITIEQANILLDLLKAGTGNGEKADAKKHVHRSASKTK